MFLDACNKILILIISVCLWFRLFRLKDAVLKQLPGKSVKTVLCEMTANQRNIYDKTKENLRLGLHKQGKGKYHLETCRIFYTLSVQ